MPLEETPLTAYVYALPMKRKSMIDTPFELEYTCVIEHMVYNSDSPEAWMSILGNNFPANFGEFNILRSSVLILLVLPGECVKLSFLKKTLSMFFTNESRRVVTRFNDCTLLDPNFNALSQRRRQTLFQKRDKFLSKQKCPLRLNSYLSFLLFPW